MTASDLNRIVAKTLVESDITLEQFGPVLFALALMGYMSLGGLAVIDIDDGDDT